MKAAGSKAAGAEGMEDHQIKIVETQQLAVKIDELKQARLLALPTLLADDATPEAVARLLNGNTGRLACISAEGGPWIASWVDHHGKRRERSARTTDRAAAERRLAERFDFHSLRHSCGAWAATSGAHPKAVQAVMRHSSITLTMGT